jgi:hypothetical protein
VQQRWGGEDAYIPIFTNISTEEARGCRVRSGAASTIQLYFSGQLQTAQPERSRRHSVQATAASMTTKHPRSTQSRERPLLKLSKPWTATHSCQLYCRVLLMSSHHCCCVPCSRAETQDGVSLAVNQLKDEEGAASQPTRPNTTKTTFCLRMSGSCLGPAS